MDTKHIRKKTTVRRNTNGVTEKTDEPFSPIIEAFRNDAQVSLGRMFGSTGLKVNGKVFTMMVKGDLVVKLPRERVDVLIDAGLGEHFDPGHGRVMKEWIAIKPKAQAQWLKLAKEAKQFVGSVP